MILQITGIFMLSPFHLNNTSTGTFLPSLFLDLDYFLKNKSPTVQQLSLKRWELVEIFDGFFLQCIYF